jgi:hypothetical protein
MEESSSQVYDFESPWRRTMIFLAGFALFVVGVLAYGLISGRGPVGWVTSLGIAVLLCLIVAGHVHLLVRRVVIDGDRFTFTTWTRQRTVAMEDITHTSWFQMYRLLQYRGGMVLVPAPLGLGKELVAELKAARPRKR